MPDQQPDRPAGGSTVVTIYHVAKRAGVSPATVSRVFNGIHVSPKLAESVRVAAAELGFVPNRNAQRLRTSSSQIIAMLIPDIENPFYTVMVRAVEDIARARGYSVMLCNTDEDPDKEEEYLRVAVSDPVAGIILVPSSAHTKLEMAMERGVPVVCVDRRPAGGVVDAVVADNAGGARVATRLAFESGYRRVGCITGPVKTETATERARGWRIGVEEMTGSPPDEDLEIRADFTVAGGEQAAAAMLAIENPPDAIFCANNKLAAGVLRVLADRGLLPPTIGVVAFGGLPLVILAPRNVMVTHLPVRQIGISAATMLLERIDGLDVAPREVVLPVVVGDEDSGMWLIEGVSNR